MGRRGVPQPEHTGTGSSAGPRMPGEPTATLAVLKPTESRPHPVRAILYGALAVAVLDALDAMLFFGIARGVRPMAIFQSIAAGLLGRAAFRGGLPTALLGGVLHFIVATCIVSTYCVVSRRIHGLARRPWLYGPLYGILVFFTMRFVVVPLSAALQGPLTLPLFLNGVIGHAILVGPPAALAARAIARARPTGAST